MITWVKVNAIIQRNSGIDIFNESPKRVKKECIKVLFLKP